MSSMEFATTMLHPQSASSRQAIMSSLSAIRNHLGMSVAYVSEFTTGRTVLRYVDAPGLEPLIKEGDIYDSDELYCLNILDGELPELVPNTDLFPVASSMPITQTLRIGAHLSIPIYLKNGDPYGMFCCFGPHPNNSLNHRDLETMRLFADLVAQQIQSDMEQSLQMREKRTRIMEALETSAFAIAYQPIVHLGGMHPCGYEALCRFSAEPYRTPDVWFKEAAEIGMAVELELAVIREAMSAIDMLDPEQYVSLNISPATILSAQFLDTFSRLPLSRIVLELTEHVGIEDYERFTKILSPLRRRGLRLAVDDAGAGHSSLRHIVQLNPDYVKVDMSLTRNVDSDLARRALIGALLYYTRETSAQIIAEGIETMSELQTLKLLGVRRGQGYLLGRPSRSMAKKIKILRAS